MVLLWHILVLTAALMGDWAPLLKAPLPTPYKQKQQEEALSGAKEVPCPPAGVPLTGRGSDPVLPLPDREG